MLVTSGIACMAHTRTSTNKAAAVVRQWAVRVRVREILRAPPRRGGAGPGGGALLGPPPGRHPGGHFAWGRGGRGGGRGGGGGGGGYMCSPSGVAPLMNLCVACVRAPPPLPSGRPYVREQAPRATLCLCAPAALLPPPPPQGDLMRGFAPSGRPYVRHAPPRATLCPGQPGPKPDLMSASCTGRPCLLCPRSQYQYRRTVRQLGRAWLPACKAVGHCASHDASS
jgi:hypothetical protein